MKKSQPIIERPLPHSPEAEANVLGAILLDGRAVYEIEFLQPKDFFSFANRTIFSTMLEMSEEGTPIELVTLYDRLAAKEELEKAGGAVYVAKLMDGMPKVVNVRQYGKMVYERSARRALIHATNLWTEIGLHEDVSAWKLKEQIENGLIELSMRYAVDMLEDTDFRKAAIAKLNKSEQASALRINTGISVLDKMTGGFRAGELVTVTAGTGVGKTLFAQQTRRFSCNQGHHFLYCTAEMTAEQLSGRELASETGVPHWKMRQPEHITEREYSALVEKSLSECTDCRILDGELSLSKIWSVAHRFKRSGKLDCVVVDYDELVNAPGKDEFAQQRNFTRGMKALAMKLAIPVIVISQLRKSLNPQEAKKPTLERLYGSGSKSKHSSFVLFVDREYVRELKGDETKARICILKSRDGRVGEIKSRFNLSTLRFEDALKEQDENF